MRCVFILGALLLSACGNAQWTSIYREGELRDGSIVTVDARQRFLHTVRTEPNGPLRTCAERSPDVFTAAASALAASGSSPEGLSAALSASSAESGASIALRTQTTQAQAELLYRLCSMNANGAITNNELSAHLRRFQNTMVAMLAIEQLTGVARVAAFAIGADASGGTGTALGSATELRQAVTTAQTSRRTADEAEIAARNNLRDARADLQTRQGALADSSADPSGRTALVAQVETAQRAVRQNEDAMAAATRRAELARTDEREAVRQLREAGVAVRTTGATSATLPALDENSAPIHEPIAVAIAQIVDSVVHQNFVQETCLQSLINALPEHKPTAPAQRPVRDETIHFCRGVLDRLIGQREANAVRQENMFNRRLQAFERTARFGSRSVPLAPSAHSLSRGPVN